MSNLYLAQAGSEHLRVANGWNAALVVAADVAGAKTALKAAKVTGDHLDSVLDAFTYSEISASAGTLPNGSSVLWLQGAKGFASGKAE